MKSIRGVVIASIFFASCALVDDLSSPSDSQAALYNPSKYSINSDFRIFHVSDEISTLYIRLFPSELLFNQANDDGEYRAMVKLDYSLYELDGREQIKFKVDSSVSFLKLGKKDQERSAYLSSLIIPVPSGKKFLLKMEISDLQRGTSGLAHILVDKVNKLSSQNFSIVSASTGMPKFMEYHRSGEVFSLRYRDRNIDTVFLDFFKENNALPRPPIRRLGFKPLPIARDTTIALQFSDTIIFTLPGEGKYHFRIDSSKEEGVTMYNFGDTYPQIRNEKDMIKPLFYISYPAEYKRLMESNGSKIAIDEFWLKRASNMDRSRELIRIYYNRVLYSNIFFTAGKEGWKTDRGMVYILFGPPDRMKDTGTSQIWYYVSRRRGVIVEFKFNRDSDYFTNEAFNLEKNQFTLKYLDDAVRSWNKGKIHSLSN